MFIFVSGVCLFAPWCPGGVNEAPQSSGKCFRFQQSELGASAAYGEMHRKADEALN